MSFRIAEYTFSQFHCVYGSAENGFRLHPECAFLCPIFCFYKNQMLKHICINVNKY